MRFHTNLLVLTGSVLLLLSSCTKDPLYMERTDSKENVVIFLKQATTQSVDLQLFPFVDEARTLTLNAGFGAIGYPNSNVTVKLDVDTRAFDSVNAIRTAAGLELYEPFPADAFVFTDRDLTIAGGTLTSNLASLSYYPKKFDPTKNYLMPISITDASGFKVNPKAKTAYLIASELAGKPANTEGWTAAASSEMPEYENTGLASAVLDGNINTIWHSVWWPEEPPYPHWITVDMQQEYYVDKIGMIPRQNNPNGFARFNLEASVDGTNWTMLLEDASFDPTNKSQQTYPLTPAPWRHFKLTMTAGREEWHTSTHLAEFIVYKY